MRFDIATYSDKGPRLVNEDAWNYHAFNEDTIAICVADGVGGNPCGQKASQICANNFISYVAEPERLPLRQIAYKIDADIKKYATNNSECTGLATTLSGCILAHGLLTGVHIGDTRVYVLRGNGIRQLTQDHTEVERLIREKLLLKANVPFYHRKNVLEMALGSTNALEPLLFEFKLLAGDRIILTTDGVHNIIKKAMIRDISLATPDINDFAKSLINKLLSSKLKDNVTFVVAQVNY
ncbi:MAG: PP2C family protein-serine/threonine phosphatase [Janthinobacterium lividum]